MAIRTGTGRGQLWSPYKSWTHFMQSSEQPCWRVVQPGCQGWLKDIFYTGVFLTESNFPARSTIVALFFLKGDSSSGKCHLSPYRNWSTASTPGHSERASCRSSTRVSCNIPHVCSMTPQRYTFINKVVWGGREREWEWLLLLFRSSDTSRRFMNTPNNPSSWCQPVVDQSVCSKWSCKMQRGAGRAERFTIVGSSSSFGLMRRSMWGSVLWNL